MTDSSQPPWLPVARAIDLSEGQSLEVVVGSELIALFRACGKLYAIEATCAHQGGPLAKGTIEKRCVRCPWHGWTYDLANGVNQGNGKPMLKTYPVREVDGSIEILCAANE